jgi:hypothetical protein
MRKLLLTGTICAALVSPWLGLQAAETDTSPGATQPDKPKLTVELKDGEVSTNDPFKLTGVGLTITDAIIDFANNARKATVNLEWKLLPTGPAFAKEQRRAFARSSYPPEVIEFEIPNDHLGNPKDWVADVPSDQRRDLIDALRIVSLEGFTKEDSDNKYSNYWLPPRLEPEKNDGSKESRSEPEKNGGWKAFESRRLLSSQFLAALRDHYYLSFLLASKGVVYSLDVQHPSVVGRFPRVLSEGIRWKITLYKYGIKDEKDQRINYYRVQIRAVMPQFQLIFANSANREIKAALNAGISFRQSPETAALGEIVIQPLSIGSDADKKPDIVVTQETVLAEENKKKRPTSDLTALLGILGGKGALAAATGSLFGGTSNTSLVTGGLISGGRVEPLVGVNVGFNNSDAVPGILFGAGLSGRNSFFLGPSLQASAFTLAVGGTLFENEKASDFQLAGVVSVDLSRLLGGRTETTSLVIDETQSAPQLGKSSDEVVQDLTAVLLGSGSKTEKDEKAFADKTFSLRRIADGFGEPLPSKMQNVVTLKGKTDSKLWFLPKGTYRYEGIGELPLEAKRLLDGDLMCLDEDFFIKRVYTVGDTVGGSKLRQIGVRETGLVVLGDSPTTLMIKAGNDQGLVSGLILPLETIEERLPDKKDPTSYRTAPVGVEIKIDKVEETSATAKFLSDPIEFKKDKEYLVRTIQGICRIGEQTK